MSITAMIAEQQYYDKIDECIARFKNGRERFRNSATFNIVIQQLIRGVDPYEIIDQLCQNQDDITNAFREHIKRDPKSHSFLTPPHANRNEINTK